MTARTAAQAGGLRDPTPPGTSCGDLSVDNFVNSVSLEEEDVMRDLPSTAARMSWARVMKITTRTAFAPPSLASCASVPVSLKFHLNGLSRRSDVCSSAWLGLPEKPPIPCVPALLSRAQPHPSAMR